MGMEYVFNVGLSLKSINNRFLFTEETIRIRMMNLVTKYNYTDYSKILTRLFLENIYSNGSGLMKNSIKRVFYVKILIIKHWITTFSFKYGDKT